MTIAVQGIESLKSDIIELLLPLFGERIRRTIDEYYNSPDELLELTRHLLTGYYGTETAKKIINKIMRKYSSKKVY